MAADVSTLGRIRVVAVGVALSDASVLAVDAWSHANAAARASVRSPNPWCLRPGNLRESSSELVDELLSLPEAETSLVPHVLDRVDLLPSGLEALCLGPVLRTEAGQRRGRGIDSSPAASWATRLSSRRTRLLMAPPPAQRPEVDREGTAEGWPGIPCGLHCILTAVQPVPTLPG